MRTILILTALFLVFSSFVYFETPTDYRDAYCGNYMGKKFSQSYNTETHLLNYDSSNYTIAVNKNQNDSALDITIAEGVFTLKLVNDNLQGNGSKYYGKFSGNTLRFYYRPALGPYYSIYIATK